MICLYSYSASLSVEAASGMNVYTNDANVSIITMYDYFHHAPPLSLLLQFFYAYHANIIVDFVKILRLWIENYENCAWENKQNLKEEEPLNEVYLVNFCTFTFRQKIHKIYSQQKKLFNSLRSAFHKLNLILLTTTLPSAWKRDGREV